MQTPTKTPKDEDFYDRAGQAARETSTGENAAAQAAKDQSESFERDFGGDNYEKDSPTSGSDILNKNEQDEGNKQGNSGDINFTGSGQPSSRPQLKDGKIRQIASNKKYLASAGIIGALGTIIAVFLALLPLKLEMFINNITDQASAVPAYAIEQRTEYLMTRALATRLLVASGADVGDGKLVFCDKGSIACHLYSTWSNNYFENKLGLKIEAEANGRARLGGRATNWTDIVVTKDDNIKTTVDKINSRKEAKKFIKTHVRESTRPTQIVSRYLATKILLRKFGIKKFGGPEKLENARNGLTEAKTRLKANIVRGTIGRVSPRMSTYLACLQGQTALCKDIAGSLGSPAAVDDPGTREDFEKKNPGKDYNEARELFEQSKGASQLASNVAGDTPDPGDSAATKKFISRQVIGLIGGGTLGVSVLDLMFKAVGAVDDGALESIWYDMASQTYTNFAMENVVITNEKMKAGDLDIDTLGAATSLFDGAESSPLMQYENGTLNKNSLSSLSSAAAAGDGRVTTDCTTDEGETPTTLAKGELICPEEKVVRDYTSQFASNPSWKTLSATATVWNKSVGWWIKSVNDTLGNIISKIPGVEQVTELAGKALGPLMGWFISLVFDPPSVGTDSAGSTNYVGLSSGIRVTQNQTMAENADIDGTAMGGGGRVLSDEEVLAITNDYTQEGQNYIASSSNIPAFINPRLKGSLTQQLLAYMPTNLASLSMTPSRLFSAALNGGTIASAAAYGTFAASPTGIPIYGYTDTDGVFDADTGKYTEGEDGTKDTCAESRSSRIDSLKLKRNVSPIATYQKSDPCALEKMVVGAQLAANDVTDDKYSFKDPIASGSSAGTDVMSFNILGAEQGKRNRNDGGFSVTKRADAAISIIQERQPAILGLQEVNDVQFNYIKDRLAGYESQPGASKGPAQPESIMWNTSVFEPEPADKGSYTYPKNGKTSTGVWVKLQALSGGGYVYAFNAHPTAEARPDERKRVTQIILDTIKKVNKDNSPVVITGDFNASTFLRKGDKGASLSDLPPSILKAAGYNNTKDLAPESSIINNDYQSSHTNAGTPRQKDKRTDRGNKIDHIFVSGTITVNKWENIIDDNSKIASDHTPIITNLNIPGITNPDTQAGFTGSLGFPVDAKYWKTNRPFFTKPHLGAGAFTGGASADLPFSLGTPVYAMVGGTVSRSSFGKNAGLEITSKIDGGTLKIAYAHGPRTTPSKTSYNAGDKIMSIGAIGPKVTGPHLHIDMAFNGKAVCPQDVFIAIGNNQKPNFANLTKKASGGCRR